MELLMNSLVRISRLLPQPNHAQDALGRLILPKPHHAASQGGEVRNNSSKVPTITDLPQQQEYGLLPEQKYLRLLARPVCAI